MDKPAERPAPRSTDLNGWRKAIADNHLGLFTLEAITVAFQDLRLRSDRDEYVEQELIKYLSASILRILRKHVGLNHPNRGEDIMFRAHHQLITALLKPKSADGGGMREAFASRVLFRMKDALAPAECPRDGQYEDLSFERSADSMRGVQVLHMLRK